jgi:hypothetical protein
MKLEVAVPIELRGPNRFCFVFFTREIMAAMSF